MIKSNLHMHTVFCDGKNTPEEMVLAAISAGYDTVGFSAHGFTPFDQSYCVKNGAEFAREIERLKAKYAAKICILTGVEADFYGVLPEFKTDYIIGAVHYVKKSGEYIPVDLDKNTFVECVDEHYGGDFFSFAKDYYDTVAEMVNALKPDILGHFDLLNKYNGDNSLFDQKDARYTAILRAACERIKGAKPTVEINVGNIISGNANEPYPSFAAIEILKEYGFRFCLSLDAHSVKAFEFDYKTILEKLRSKGIRKLMVWKSGVPTETEI